VASLSLASSSGLVHWWGPFCSGVFWGLWHLPLFLLIPGYDGAGTGFVGILGPFVLFFIFVIAASYVFTWVFNNTRGSLLLMMLFHASINTALSSMPSLLFPSIAVSSEFLFGLSAYGVVVVVALLVIAATRGRLSYKRYQSDTALSAPGTDREQEPRTGGASV
jgi:uncharacterized protein